MPGRLEAWKLIATGACCTWTPSCCARISGHSGQQAMESRMCRVQSTYDLLYGFDIDWHVCLSLGAALSRRRQRRHLQPCMHTYIQPLPDLDTHRVEFSQLGAEHRLAL